jgi:prepilin-type N-terminal cleavage/methylation domain-containing protein
MTAHNPFQGPAQGFTLLETLVALMVMSLVVLTLLRLHSGTLQLAGAGKFSGMVPFLAEGKLAALESAPENLSGRSGDFGPEYSGLEWTCTMEEADFDDPSPLTDQTAGRLKKIQLHLSSPESGRSHTITTWRYLVVADE